MPLTKEQTVIVDQVKPILDLVPTIEKLKGEIDNNPTNFSFLANTAYVARKCSEMLNEMRKELDKLEEKVAQVAFDQWPNIKPPKWSTEFCTIKDNSDVYIKYPSRPDDPGYYDFVKAIGPDLVRPYYPAIGPAFIEIVGRGDAVPWGLKAADVKGLNYKLYIRKKKDL